MSFRPSIRRVFAALMFALICGGGGIAVADWPVARGDAQSSGFAAKSLPETLRLAWQCEIGQAIETTPVIAGNRLFVTDVFGGLHAVDLTSGDQIWSKPLDVGFSASPSVWTGVADQPDDDRIIVGDVDGSVAAFLAIDGSELWRHQTDGEIDAAAAINGDQVLVTSQDGSLTALAIADGKPQWTYQTDDQLRCSATVIDGQTFLGGCDAKLHRVDLTSGKSAGEPIEIDGPTGSTPAGSPIAGSTMAGGPMVESGDRLVLPVMSGIVYAIDLKTGEKVWQYEDETFSQEYRTDAAVDGEITVVASARKNVDALSLKTGERLWRYTLRRRSDASPIIVGDDVWIASSDGRLIRLNKKTGKEIWVHEIRGSFLASPAINNDRLYVADDDGIIRCFAAADNDAADNDADNN